MDDPKNLHAAIAYTRLGWNVFAIRPKSKAPLTLHGFQDATMDTSILRKWWDKNPACGVGIATGGKSGIIVVDIDPRNDGDATVEALELEHGAFPKTIEAKTGGGGRHLIYKLPSGVFPGVKDLWKGVDIKANGGYIVAPFSVHPNGLEYKWVEGQEPGIPGEKGGIEPTLIPAWVLKAMTAKKKQQVESLKDRTPDGGRTPDGRILFPKGKRNDALTSLAGTMQRRAMTPSAILAALLAENAFKCSPPLPESDVQIIVDSVCRYKPDASTVPSGASERAISGKLLEWIDPVKMAQEKPPPVEWLLPGWLAKGDCSLLFGPPAIGKSWVILDIAITLCSGLPTFGVIRPEGEVFKVLLVDEENPPDEVWRRIHCISKAWELDPKVLEGQLFMTKPRQGFTFRDDSYIYALQKEIERIKPDLVILDSVTALSSIKNENDAIEVRAFFHDKLYPLQRICNSAFLCVHHSTKGIYAKDQQVSDEGLSRGSIDFQGATDSVMMMKPVQGKNYSILKANKIRRGKKPTQLKISIVDGEKGGCRPLVIAGSPVSTPVTHNEDMSIPDCIKDMVLAKEGITPTNLVTWVNMALPKVVSGDIELAIGLLVGQGFLILEADGSYSWRAKK